MEDVDETVEDEELEDEGADDVDGEAPPASGSAAPSEEPVESIQEILVKQEAGPDAEEEDSVLSMGREERLEPLAVKVVPPQPTEFICSNCYLVKHRSQLKDKAKVLCRDCA